ncbi:MAG: hypothetical protein ABSF12_10950 [Bryobacteraceae bacterium]
MPRCRWALGIIWLAFLLRGAFYCQLIPLWEGYDEWGHYAFVEHLRLHHGSLPRTSDGVSEEIHQSVESAFIKHEAAEPLKLFEAQQPPLYYWVLSVPNRIWIGAPISTRIRRLRMFSILIASLAIPFAYLAAFELFYSRRIALSVCALIAVMPELMIDVVRIGNESLAIALASWIIWLLLRTRAPALGLALGLGLLTKAYFLAFIPILILRRRFYSLAFAIGISGWWYWRNFRSTGTLTGEIMDVAARHLSWSTKLAAFQKVHWLSAIDTALWTHIWSGAWSFFTVKSWMYRVFEVIYAIVLIMVIYALLKRPIGRFKVKLWLLLSVEALFIAGISYQTVTIYLEKGISFTPGWYFYALIVAEALLLATGMLILAGRKRVLLAMGFLIGLFAALDVYSAIFVLARHYKH